jgi:hypothetical protein
VTPWETSKALDGMPPYPPQGDESWRGVPYTLDEGGTRAQRRAQAQADRGSWKSLIPLEQQGHVVDDFLAARRAGDV